MEYGEKIERYKSKKDCLKIGRKKQNQEKNARRKRKSESKPGTRALDMIRDRRTWKEGKEKEMKGAIVEEIRMSVVKRKRSQRPWQSCDPSSVTSSSFASSLNMTALPSLGPRGAAWAHLFAKLAFHSSPTHTHFHYQAPSICGLSAYMWTKVGSKSLHWQWVINVDRRTKKIFYIYQGFIVLNIHTSELLQSSLIIYFMFGFWQINKVISVFSLLSGQRLFELL